MKIELKNISKSFGNTQAVKNFSLSVKDGELLTILGPSGCGKTTVLRIILGAINQDEGNVLFGGKIVDEVPLHKRGVGIVFQSYALFPHMNVYDNIAFGLKIRKVPKNIIKEKVGKITDLLGINGLEGRFPNELSGGEQQRVSLGRALVIEPNVLLMDEPLSNLDAKLRIKLRYGIRNIQKTVGITTVYVTHDQEEALAISDRIVLMNRGVLEQVGTPRDIFSKPKTEFVIDFMGIKNLPKESWMSTFGKNNQKKDENRK